MIPVSFTPGSLTPAYSFDQIGIQIFYFPSFATYHLAALKEQYLHGVSTQIARTQYTKKVQEYSSFLNTYLPIFASYADFIRVDSNKQINDADTFLQILKTSTLEFTPQQFKGKA